MIGTLYIVSVPIGNAGDITLRALETLRNAPIILCEDLKPARRLMHDLKLEKELLPLNEHTERSATDEALELLRNGSDLALISDAGTPLVQTRVSNWSQKRSMKVYVSPLSLEHRASLLHLP